MGFAWLGSVALHASVLLAVRSGGSSSEPSVPALTRLSGTTFELTELPGNDERGGRPSLDSGDTSSGVAAREPSSVSVPTDDAAPREGAEPNEVPKESIPTVPRRTNSGSSPSESLRARVQHPPAPDARGGVESERFVSSPSRGAGDAPPAPASESGAGTYGEEGVRAERGRFPDAFTRVLPAAAQGLQPFYGAPEGRLVKAIVRVSISEDGRLESLAASGKPSKALDTLFASVRILLRSGRFALPPGSRGTFEIGLVVDVEMGEADEDLLVDERDVRPAVRQLSSKYPTAREPGEALVRYGSGKRVVLRVFEEPKGSDF